MSHKKDKQTRGSNTGQSTLRAGPSIDRRSALRLGLGLGALFPFVWVPKPAYAQQCRARGSIRHLIYLRLAGGFRFTTAFNANVAQEYNPFGRAATTAPGTEWGPSSLLERAPWLEGTSGQALSALGMRPVTEFSNEIAVLATVDHEPSAGNADGNHGSGLERYLTGRAGGDNSFFTMIHYGLRQRIEAFAREGRIELPPFVLGASGMALGHGPYAAYRPPLVQSESFDGFTRSGTSALPAWAKELAGATDERFRDRHTPPARAAIEAYVGTRQSTERFREIFTSDLFSTGAGGTELVDGISNRELNALFGDGGTARRLQLALRLFHFGCPAVYLDQGSYDLHADEDERLPDQLAELTRLLAGLHVALKRMQHPSGGSYWDHTLVVLGSEFGRTARGASFNSAGGSDHGGDLATRWMSMPFMGGLVTQLGIGGRQFGATRASDLAHDGRVFSYRSVCKTLLDLLCADHAEFFSNDSPITDIF